MLEASDDGQWPRKTDAHWPAVHRRVPRGRSQNEDRITVAGNAQHHRSGDLAVKGKATPPGHHTVQV